VTSSRSGVTIYMVLAILLGLVIIGTTFTLNSLRKITPPPFLLKQKAEYQMESAFVLCLSKLDQFAAGGPAEPLVRQEIAPGAWLTVTATPDGPNRWNLDARVQAEHWSRSLRAVAAKSGSGTEAATASSAPALHAPAWTLQFLAAEPTALTPAESGRAP